MTKPDRLKKAKQIAESTGQDILDVLAEMPRAKVKYKKNMAYYFRTGGFNVNPA